MTTTATTVYDPTADGRRGGARYECPEHGVTIVLPTGASADDEADYEQAVEEHEEYHYDVEDEQDRTLLAANLAMFERLGVPVLEGQPQGGTVHIVQYADDCSFEVTLAADLSVSLRIDSLERAWMWLLPSECAESWRRSEPIIWNGRQARGLYKPAAGV